MMDPHNIAAFVDFIVSMLGGVLATLFGFRIIGKAERMDAWYAKWGKHLRWIGPGYIFLTLIRLFAFTSM
jgi:hypothetical protein